MTPAELLITKPDPAHGIPIPGLGDWRLALEVMLPADLAARWGVARWGETEWGEWTWVDLSDRVRGAVWYRGATEFDGNPEVGEAVISLANTDRALSPWNTASPLGVVLPASYSPGASGIWGVSEWAEGTWGAALPFGAAYQPGWLGLVARLVAHSPSGMVTPLTNPATLNPASPDSWVAQFTGVVEAMPELTTGNGADSQVDMTLVELPTLLARVNATAGSLVGSGDLPAARLARLTAGLWPFGIDATGFAYEYVGSSAYGLQSTEMSLNRWGECILTAESVGGVVRSAREGTLTLYNRWSRTGIARGPESAASVVDVDAYIADSAVITEHDENVVNVVALARAGGTAQSDRDQFSVNVFGERWYSRSDLIGQSDPLVADHLIPRYLNARAFASRRLEAIELDAARNAALVTALDVHDRVDVDLPGYATGLSPRARDATVDSLAHSLTVTTSGLASWRAVVRFGAQSVLTS